MAKAKKSTVATLKFKELKKLPCGAMVLTKWDDTEEPILAILTEKFTKIKGYPDSGYARALLTSKESNWTLEDTRSIDADQVTEVISTTFQGTIEALSRYMAIKD